MEIKGIVKKKFPLKSGRFNRKFVGKTEFLNHATAKEREQYEKEIRAVKSMFDGII